jgi:NDP-sugar pyrophosphorylase family protein
VCEPAILALIPPGVSDFGYDIIPALIASGAPVCGRLVEGRMLDIGTHEAYAQAQRELRSMEDRRKNEYRSLF